MLPLHSFRLKNFKAVRDTGPLEFGSFTLVVGSNGSGKSSLLEGMEVLHELGSTDVETIFGRPAWRGFHHAWNKAVSHRILPKRRAAFIAENSMSFAARGRRRKEARSYGVSVEISQDASNEMLIVSESVRYGGEKYERNGKGEVTGPGGAVLRPLGRTVSLLSYAHVKPLSGWQFLNLNASAMGQPARRAGKEGGALSSDGSNLAEVLRKLSPDGLARLIESLQQILGYARDLQVDQFSAVDRTVYLKMKEGDFGVPGWLLSGGTVRLVAILACLYHDDPPPLLVIDELENGLDPRTVGFLINQIREAVQSGRTQIIATTHSPHLLSQVSLEHLLLCQRMESGEPKFWRPGDSVELQKWSEDFNPGDLYASGRIQKEMTKALRGK